jgi:hypothetical protein
LSFPVELIEDDKVSAYNQWAEKRLVGPLRLLAPERHDAVVKQLRSFIGHTAESEDDDT